MKKIIGIGGGRPWPKVLAPFLQSAELTLEEVDPGRRNWTRALDEAWGVVAPAPAWGQAAYLSVEALWWRFLRQHYPTHRLLLASFQTSRHPNQLDLLALPEAPLAWRNLTEPAHQQEKPPASGGMDLEDKLRRFFSGHGEDSVIAVINRLRLIVQMAEREVVMEQTPYPEVYRDLLAPAQLAAKWSEWQNRWVNYYPLFQQTPFAAVLRSVARDLHTLEPWMNSGGQAVEPLRDGSLLLTLNRVRQQLYQIEHDYVGPELSHSNRG